MTLEQNIYEIPFIFEYNKIKYDMSPVSVRLKFTRDIQYKSKEIILFGRSIIILNNRLTLSYSKGVKLLKGTIEPYLDKDKVGIVIRRNTIIEIICIPKLAIISLLSFLPKSIKVEIINCKRKLVVFISK